MHKCCENRNSISWDTETSPSRSILNGQQLQQIENFVYLGGIISTNDGWGKDIERRIGLARGMLQTLNRIWTFQELSKQTKMRLYETLVECASIQLGNMDAERKG